MTNTNCRVGNSATFTREVKLTGNLYALHFQSHNFAIYHYVKSGHEAEKQTHVSVSTDRMATTKHCLPWLDLTLSPSYLIPLAF